MREALTPVPADCCNCTSARGPARFGAQKLELGVAVQGPKAAQHRQGRLGQGHQPVAVALGVTHLDARALGVTVGHGQSQALTQAQAQDVEGEEQHPVVEHAGVVQDDLDLGIADDVGPARDLGWEYDARHRPRLAQHVFGEELQAVQIELDAAPGMRGLHLGEVVRQLSGRECGDLVVEMLPNAPHGTRIGLHRLGPQALDLQVLQVAAIQPGKGLGKRCGINPADKIGHG